MAFDANRRAILGASNQEGGHVSDTTQSPTIWRCAGCGALVHPADESAPAAWCPRCQAVTLANRDGG